VGTQLHPTRSFAVVLNVFFISSQNFPIAQNKNISFFIEENNLSLSLFPVCAQRVVLSEDELCVVCSGESRVARLLKSPSQQYRVARYHITPDGIR
jgi:hypothetical protein